MGYTIASPYSLQGGITLLITALYTIYMTSCVAIHAGFFGKAYMEAIFTAVSLARSSRG